MVSAGRKHNRIVQCGIQRMSSPFCQEAAEAVRSGAIGARLTGAGFGGCVVAVSFRDDAVAVADRAAAAYLRATSLEPTIYLCRAVDGAGPVTSDAREPSDN